MGMWMEVKKRENKWKKSLAKYKREGNFGSRN
jgi:hypothetical protein